MDTDIPCWLCDKTIRGKKEAEDSKYEMYEGGGSRHTHNKVTVSDVLEDIHYPDSEDKSGTVEGMTLEELEGRIDKIAYKIAAMSLGTYLHAQNGYEDKGFKHNFFKKKFEVDGTEYYITAKIDKIDGETMHEAKFTGSSRGERKVRKYAEDQCDIYSWVTGMVDCQIAVHVIPANETNAGSYKADPGNGERLVHEYIRKSRSIRDFSI